MEKTSADSTKYSKCGKNFRAVMAFGKKSEVSELIIKDGKEKWICPDCRNFDTISKHRNDCIQNP